METQFRKIWDELPFEGFDKKILPAKKEEWCRYAGEISNRINDENVGFVADTAAGKTIIAFLVVLAKDLKTLFLAPTRNLCGQHRKLLHEIMGGLGRSRLIIGTTPKKKRIWNDPSNKIIFSTPHMAENEASRGNIRMADFDLIIIDEFHKTSGNYPYTKVIKRTPPGTKLLCLSASPGDDSAKIEQVEKVCRIGKWIIADIKTPPKLKDLVIAEPDETMDEISRLFDALLKDTLFEIKKLIPTADINIEKKHLFNFTETEKWNEQAGKLSTDRQIRTARFFIAKYIKLYHSYSTAIKETYAAFTDYVQKLKKQKAKSAQSIINERRFSRIVRLAGENTDRHPKASMLLKVMEQWIRMEKNALVFVGQKVSGGYLSDLLRQEGIRSDNIFGGDGKANFEKQKKALQGIAEGELQTLIATSVIEEGVSVPEVDMVLNYSRTQTGVGTKQRDGRTARLRTGNIVNLVINHPLDEVEYWISQSKARRGDKELKKHIQDKKLKKPKQINLFTGEEEK